MYNFSAFLGTHSFEHIWSYGATFDIAILNEIYRLVRFSRKPWTYKQERDTRTLCDAAGYTPAKNNIHHAFKDAINQARDVQAATAIPNKQRAAWRLFNDRMPTRV